VGVNGKPTAPLPRGSATLRHGDRLIIAILVIGSFLPRLVLRNNGLFHHDSVCIAEAVEATVEESTLHPVWLQDPPVGGRYGLVLVNAFIHAVDRRILGGASAERDLLFSAAFFGSLAVGMLYLLAREIQLSRPVAAGAAVLLSLNPVFFSETAGAKEHGLALFLALIALWLAARAARTSSPTIALVGGLVGGASGFVRESAALAAVPALIILVSGQGGRRRRTLPAFVLGASIPLGLLLWVQWEWVETFRRVTGYRGFDPFLMGMALKDVTASITPAGYAFLLAGGVVSVKNPKLLAFTAWLLVTFFYFANLSQYSARFLIETFAAAALLIGAGVDRLLGRWRAAHAAAIILLAVVPFAQTWRVLAYRHEHIGGKETGRILAERTPANAVVFAMDDAPFVRYYGRRDALQFRISEPEDPRATRDEILAFCYQLAGYIRQGRPVYLLKTALAYDTPDRLLGRALRSGFESRPVATFKSEDYHRASIRGATFDQELIELRLRTTD
jgi:hypothetical protein